jgi:hypothetical protein
MSLTKAGGLLRPGEEWESPPGQGASGSHHLPWAFSRVLQVAGKIKRVGASVQHADRAAVVSAERMRATLSSPAGTPANTQAGT